MDINTSLCTILATFVGNKAIEGGAIELTPLGEGYIMNCNFSQNFAERGGAIGISFK